MYDKKGALSAAAPVTQSLSTCTDAWCGVAKACS